MFEDDQDSLFGSPPPSPIRGRSPALPPQAAQEKGGSIIKNVGTIALPGSHMSCSELPAELPALPLGGLSAQEPLRPSVLPLQPAQNTLQRHFTQSRATSSALSSSRASSISRPPSSTTRKRKSTKSKSSTPRPEPPPILFPGPDDPLPPNFLRSQKALLGIAGLVGDIKPTNFSHQTLQGSTPSNPIVIEESGPTPFAQCTHLPPGNPSPFPPVNGEDVITSLITQKNIFPVLSSMLKLLGNSNSPEPLGRATHTRSFSRPYGAPTMTGPPPPKRRKLTNVPAGAVDWDVPYPFPEGEGPDSYHATWERERARQLIVQLLDLLKGAAQGAAARKYARKTKMEMKRRRLEDEGADHGGSMSIGSSAGTEGSRCSTAEPTSERSLSSGVDASTDSLDQLLASLLSSVPSQDPVGVLNTPPAGTLPSFDEALFDSWLAELQALPPPDDPDEVTPITPVTPAPSLDDLMRSTTITPTVSTPPVQFIQNLNPVIPRRASHKPIDKEDILQRARERRRQIVAEIERAKVELWETSIEGGVLGHLTKDPTLS